MLQTAKIGDNVIFPIADFQEEAEASPVWL